MRIGIIGWVLGNRAKCVNSVLSVVEELAVVDLEDTEFVVCGTANTVENVFSDNGIKAGLNIVCIDMALSVGGSLYTDYGFTNIIKTDEIDKLKVLKRHTDYIYAFGENVKERYRGLLEMDNVEYF